MICGKSGDYVHDLNIGSRPGCQAIQRATKPARPVQFAFMLANVIHYVVPRHPRPHTSKNRTAYTALVPPPAVSPTHMSILKGNLTNPSKMASAHSRMLVHTQQQGHRHPRSLMGAQIKKPMAEIISRAGRQITYNKHLRVLPRHSHIVQGCWVGICRSNAVIRA